ncbi:MAG TPA: GntR family transcriptional regulator [Gaiellaceae bacterium]|nr:GntR family transcriptional regulator [Gaiellaceae bacterium]
MSVRVPLRQQAYEQIRDELLTRGPLAFGGRLAEEQLARRLAMSRTPVRDALRRLAVAGLVESAPGGGYLPRRPRPRDVREEYELRALLECRAAALAASRPREAADELERAEAEGRDFHLAVAHASGNEALARSIGTLRERALVHSLASSTSVHELERLREGHRAVRTAIRACDAPDAERRMAEHLALACELALAAVRTGREAA